MAGVPEALGIVANIGSAINSAANTGKTLTSGAGHNVEAKKLESKQAAFPTQADVMDAFANLSGQSPIAGFSQQFAQPVTQGMQLQGLTPAEATPGQFFSKGSPLGVDVAGTIGSSPLQSASPLGNDYTQALINGAGQESIQGSIDAGNAGAPTDYAPYLQGAATLGGLAGTVAQLAKKGPRASSSPISLNQPQFQGGGDLISMLSRLSQMGK